MKIRDLPSEVVNFLSNLGLDIDKKLDESQAIEDIKSNLKKQNKFVWIDQVATQKCPAPIWLFEYYLFYLKVRQENKMMALESFDRQVYIDCFKAFISAGVNYNEFWPLGNELAKCLTTSENKSTTPLAIAYQYHSVEKAMQSNSHIKRYYRHVIPTLLEILLEIPTIDLNYEFADLGKKINTVAAFIQKNITTSTLGNHANLNLLLNHPNFNVEHINFDSLLETVIKTNNVNVASILLSHGIKLNLATLKKVLASENLEDNLKKSSRRKLFLEFFKYPRNISFAEIIYGETTFLDYCAQLTKLTKDNIESKVESKKSIKERLKKKQAVKASTLATRLQEDGEELEEDKQLRIYSESFYQELIVQILQEFPLKDKENYSLKNIQDIVAKFFKHFKNKNFSSTESIKNNIVKQIFEALTNIKKKSELASASKSKSDFFWRKKDKYSIAVESVYPDIGGGIKNLPISQIKCQLQLHLLFPSLREQEAEKMLILKEAITHGHLVILDLILSQVTLRNPLALMRDALFLGTYFDRHDQNRAITIKSIIEAPSIRDVLKISDLIDFYKYLQASGESLHSSQILIRAIIERKAELLSEFEKFEKELSDNPINVEQKGQDANNNLSLAWKARFQTFLQKKEYFGEKLSSYPLSDIDFICRKVYTFKLAQQSSDLVSYLDPNPTAQKNQYQDMITYFHEQARAMMKSGKWIEAGDTYFKAATLLGKEINKSGELLLKLSYLWNLAAKNYAKNISDIDKIITCAKSAITALSTFQRHYPNCSDITELNILLKECKDWMQLKGVSTQPIQLKKIESKLTVADLFDSKDAQNDIVDDVISENSSSDNQELAGHSDDHAVAANDSEEETSNLAEPIPSESKVEIAIVEEENSQQNLSKTIEKIELNIESLKNLQAEFLKTRQSEKSNFLSQLEMVKQANGSKVFEKWYVYELNKLKDTPKCFKFKVLAGIIDEKEVKQPDNITYDEFQEKFNILQEKLIDLKNLTNADADRSQVETNQVANTFKETEDLLTRFRAKIKEFADHKNSLADAAKLSRIYLENAARNSAQSERKSQIEMILQNKRQAKAAEKEQRESKKRGHIQAPENRRTVKLAVKSDEKKTESKTSPVVSPVKTVAKPAVSNSPVVQSPAETKRRKPTVKVGYLEHALHHLNTIYCILANCNAEKEEKQKSGETSLGALRENIYHYSLLYNIIRCFQALILYINRGGDSSCVLNLEALQDIRNMLIHHGVFYTDFENTRDTAEKLYSLLANNLLDVKNRNYSSSLTKKQKIDLISSLNLTRGEIERYSLEPFHLVIIDTPLYQRLFAYHTQVTSNDLNSDDIKEILATILQNISDIFGVIKKVHDQAPVKEEIVSFNNFYSEHFHALKVLFTICGELARHAKPKKQTALEHFLTQCIEIRNKTGHRFSRNINTDCSINQAFNLGTIAVQLIKDNAISLHSQLSDQGTLENESKADEVETKSDGVSNQNSQPAAKIVTIKDLYDAMTDCCEKLSQKAIPEIEKNEHEKTLKKSIENLKKFYEFSSDSDSNFKKLFSILFKYDRADLIKDNISDFIATSPNRGVVADLMTIIKNSSQSNQSKESNDLLAELYIKFNDYIVLKSNKLSNMPTQRRLKVSEVKAINANPKVSDDKTAQLNSEILESKTMPVNTEQPKAPNYKATLFAQSSLTITPEPKTNFPDYLNRIQKCIIQSPFDSNEVIELLKNSPFVANASRLYNETLLFIAKSTKPDGDLGLKIFKLIKELKFETLESYTYLLTIFAKTKNQQGEVLLKELLVTRLISPLSSINDIPDFNGRTFGVTYFLAREYLNNLLRFNPVEINCRFRVGLDPINEISTAISQAIYDLELQAMMELDRIRGELSIRIPFNVPMYMTVNALPVVSVNAPQIVGPMLTFPQTAPAMMPFVVPAANVVQASPSLVPSVGPILPIVQSVPAPAYSKPKSTLNAKAKEFKLEESSSKEKAVQKSASKSKFLFNAQADAFVPENSESGTDTPQPGLKI